MIIKIRNQAPGNTEVVREYWLEQVESSPEIVLMYKDSYMPASQIYARLYANGRMLVVDKAPLI